MSSIAHEDRRIVLLGAARNLIRAAASRRASLPQNASERQFFLGVEAAALDVVHPELGESRAPAWLDHESAQFRDGYVRTSTMIAMAKTSLHSPLALRLPEPE